VLENNELNCAGIAALVRLPGLAGVRYLNLQQNAIDDIGARALAEATLDELETIHLVDNRIGAAGVTALSRAPWLSRLRVLDLSYSPLGDEGARALAESSFTTNLCDLSLSGTGVSDAGGLALAGSPFLGRIRSLFPGHGPFSPAVLSALHARFGAALLTPSDA
jgi:hypothetical protein